MRQNSTVSSVAASSRRILATAVQGVASRLFGPARTQLRATPRACEMLERRHLLTDIFGGETFTYESFDFGTISDDGEIETITVRVEVQGNSDTVVKLHGVGQGGGGGFVMSDLSGEIVSPIPGRSGPTRGGVGGLLGSTKLIDDEFVFVSELGGIQRYNLADYIGSIIPSLAGPALLATQDLITFDEIATTSTGQNFGLQLVDVQLGDLNVRQLQIAEFNTDTSDFDPNGASTNRTPGFGGDLGLRTNVGDALFRGDIIESIIAAVRAVESPDSFPPEDPMDPLADRALITSLIGADFALGDDDTLYVAAMVTVGRAASNINPIIADVDVPFIFAIDMNTLSPGGASAVAIASDFWGDPQSLDAQTVAGDVTAFGALDSDTFAMFGEFTERISEGTQQQALVPVTGLLLQDISTAQVRQLIDPDDVVPLALGGDQINRLEALQFRPDSPGFTPATTLERLYALTEGAGAGGGGEDQFIIRFNGGFFGDFTVIGGLGDVDGTTSGDSVLSLSWDPAIANPFDGGTGAFVAFDIGTDQFLVVDQRPRGVTSSSLALFNIQVLNSDDSTRITSYAVDDNGEPITLEDNPNPLAAVFNPESGEVELVEAPEGSGALYLGLKFVSDEDPPSVFTVDSLDPTEFTEGSDPFTGKLYNGRIRPGLYTVNGSLGSFFYAGIVTGNVRIEGALGEFWAGAITTGDAGLTGAGEPDNFAVFGDAGNIISATSIGVEKVVGDAPAIDSDDIPLRYSSRTEIAIGGRVNSIRGAGAIAAAIDVRGDDPAPGTDLSGTFFKRRPAGPLRELERQGNDEEADNLFIAGTPRLTNYYNDNLANYEPIGTLGNGTIQINGLISGDAADASRDDSVDYFGIGMMGGQEFEVQLTSPGSAPTASLQVAVFDPDGRMIASDYEDNGIAINSRRGQAMRIKATVPGVYRIAIAPAPDADFNEAGGDFADQLYTTEPYFLTVRNAGNITLGGIKAQGHVYAEANTVNGQDFLRLWRGDLGVVESMTGTILAFGAPPNIRVNTGSLRQLSGASLGWYTTDPNEDIGFINVRVPKGSIGALRAFGSDGDFAGDIFFNWSGVFDGDNLPLVSEAIGDDIQLVQATRDVLGNFIVGRGIGSIVAARDWGAPLSIPFGSPNNTGGAIFTNVDDLGDDGFLDILSVGGNVGQDTTNGRLLGGPAIDMGTNGNFRYFDFAPGGNLVRDPLFGISTGDPFQTLNPGETFEFVDDSGTAVSVIPIAGDEPNPNDPNDNPQATLSVLTYPVRSGGSILVTVNTTNGVEVTTNSRGPRATVEVGNIRTAGTGRPVRRDIDPNFPEGDPELVLGDSFFDPGDPLDLNDPFEDIFMRFSGTNVDIFSIDATTTAGEGGSFTEIVNNTTGELLDITGASIGTLRANRLGIPLTRGASDLRAVQNRTSFYPFNLQPYLIGVDGSIITVEAEQMGNIYAGIAQGFTIGGPEDGGDGGDGGGGDGGGGDGGGGDGGGGDGGGGGPAGIGTGTGNGNGNGGASPPPSIGSAGDGIGGLDAGNTGGGVGGIGTEVIGELAGIIGTLRPNRDGQDDPNRFEGINGPIVVATPDSGRVDGEFTLVDIGEGVLPSGSGNVGFAGLWAEGFIVEIVGNNGADIRGDVVANEINSIRLNGGSIVHADILAAPVAGNSPANADFTTTRELEIARGALPGFVEAGPEDADTVFYEFDQIEITGGGGIIGARIAAPDIFNVLVSDGFGIINSTMITLVEGEVELVDTDGLGIRNSIIGQGRDVGTVIARGDAELLNLNDFSGTVDFSGEGLVFDPFSGFALTAINDLRKALGLPDDVDPRRKRVTNSGVMENVIISGSRDIDRVEAIVMRSNLDSFNPLGTFEQTAEGFGGGNAQSPDHPMSIDFGRTITDIQTRSTHGVRVESGDLVRMNADWDVFNTEVRISGEIGDVTIGQDLWRDSSVRADGPDGFLNAITANNIYGFVSGDVGIGTMTVHNDLFSPTDAPATVLVTPSTVRALSRIDSIIVGRHIRTGAYIRSTEEIGLLQVGGDIQAGSVVQASQIDDLQVTGNIFGDIVLTS